jgi:hypothetical protein
MTAVRGRIPEEAPHLQLLLGRGQGLLDAFDVTEVRLKTPRVAGSRHLKLVPRGRLEGVEVVYLEVLPAMRQVARVLVVDPLWNESDLLLEKVKENDVVKDEDLRVRVPAGVAVREASPAASGAAASEGH